MFCPALTLAGPEGYIRTFVDEGDTLQSLLLALANRLRRRAVPGQESTPGLLAYTEKLLAAFAPPPSAAPPLKSTLLVEPLSQRELEVLRLIALGLSNREIAGKLVVGAGTVKTHINNIYRKLDVASRTQAVARARELSLLSD